MAFKKGQSGNPGGARKKDDVVTKLAKEEAPLAFKRIIEMAKDSPDRKIKLQANQFVIERAYGKAKQQVDVDANVTGSFAVYVDLESKLPDA